MHRNSMGTRRGYRSVSAAASTRAAYDTRCEISSRSVAKRSAVFDSSGFLPRLSGRTLHENAGCNRREQPARSPTSRKLLRFDSGSRKINGYERSRFTVSQDFHLRQVKCKSFNKKSFCLANYCMQQSRVLRGRSLCSFCWEDHRSFGLVVENLNLDLV